MQVPEAKLPNKNEGFIPKKTSQEESTKIELEINATEIDKTPPQTSKTAGMKKKTMKPKNEIVPNIGF